MKETPANWIIDRDLDQLKRDELSKMIGRYIYRLRFVNKDGKRNLVLDRYKIIYVNKNYIYYKENSGDDRLEYATWIIVSRYVLSAENLDSVMFGGPWFLKVEDIDKVKKAIKLYNDNAEKRELESSIYAAKLSLGKTMSKLESLQKQLEELNRAKEQ